MATGSRLGEILVARAGLSLYRTRLPREGHRADVGVPLSPELDALADRVRRLLLSHRDPERFHINKSKIECALRRLARIKYPIS